MEDQKKLPVLQSEGVKSLVSMTQSIQQWLSSLDKFLDWAIVLKDIATTIIFNLFGFIDPQPKYLQFISKHFKV